MMSSGGLMAPGNVPGWEILSGMELRRNFIAVLAYNFRLAMSRWQIVQGRRNRPSSLLRRP